MGDERVVVVVGAGSGIGRATSAVLGSAGYAVVRADLHAEGDVLAVDVVDEDSVASLFDTAVERHGSLHGVVNCAGVSTLAAIVDHDAAEFRRVVDVCLTGAFLVLKHAGRRVADGGSLVSLTEVAALELAPRRVRVNAVAPGLVVTPLTAPAMAVPGIRESYLENTPLGRSGEPEEIAAVIRFLLSDDAAWMTGETVDVNGGAHLQRYPDLLGLVAKAFG